MAFAFDELFAYGGQLIVAAKKRVPKALGIGKQKIDHSAYIEGNTLIGKVDAFSSADATLMVGRENTKGTSRALYTKGNVRIEGDGDTVDALTVSGGDVHTARFYGTEHTNAVYIDGDLFVTGAADCGNKGKLAARFATADAKPKPFDLEHPTKGKGHRLRYACIEGPEVGVYYRGRLTGSNTIELPYYWKDLVHEDSITVQLQPIGDRHFHLNVVSFDNEKIVIKEADDKSIDCFFHVFGERKDVNPLLTEYEGNDRYDYPDPNFNENSEISVEDRNYTDPNYSFPRNTITS